jgi:hypothetical protein
MKPKLIVAGCSYSDNFEVNYNYGYLLSKKLDYDYLHLAKGLGSNYRLWRKITNAIIEGKITSNDLLIIQYTTIERQEFWSEFLKNDQERHSDVSEIYHDGGTIIRFKTDACDYHKNKEEQDFLRLYQNHFVGLTYEKEKFKYMNFLFQNTLIHNKITTIFFRNRYLYEFDILKSPFLQEFIEPNYIREVPNIFDPIKDPYHLSQIGHENLSTDFYNYIKSQGIVSY